ncbi:MAG: hypothetical protein LUG98_12700 [Tannerellaceae bacterium]|nr:hypothetical protein [Tannerellaceae bacterium]
MNIYFITASLLLFFASAIHVLKGVPLVNSLTPKKEKEVYRIWLMVSAGIQLITVDLLLSGLFLLLTGVGILPYNFVFILFICLLYSGYGIAWLLVLLSKKAEHGYYFRLTHWILFLIVAALSWIGLYTEQNFSH